jgi:DNA polymerase-3 subunit epsilon
VVDKKLLFVDTETTGLNEVINEPHQIAFIIEINDNVVREEVFYAQPVNWNKISTKALEVSNMTLDKIKDYPPSRVSYTQINHLLRKFVDPYDREDKFTAVGQNVRFDMKMLDQWYRKHGNNYFYSLVDSKNELDILEMTKTLRCLGILPYMENNKLLTVCAVLKIPMENAHDALCDIRCTREIFIRYNRVFKELGTLIANGTIKTDLRSNNDL